MTDPRLLLSTLANRHLTILTLQTLMSVVDQLDQTLFETFIKPKVTAATGKLRGGILDPKMDWYETPQPTGERRPTVACCCFFFLSPCADGGVKPIHYRDPAIYV